MTAAKPFIITIVGAENSGKTSLAIFLADFFRCIWVPEYARKYLASLDRPYDEKDLDAIAAGQWEWINAAVNDKSSASTLFQHLIDEIDSNVVVDKQLIIDLIHFINVKVAEERRMVIADGGMLTMQMWSQIKYGQVSPSLNAMVNEDITDLYILCRPTKKWTPEPWREAPRVLDRAWIYNQYLRELVIRKKEFFIVALMP